jgi:hypothetical protein
LETGIVSHVSKTLALIQVRSLALALIAFASDPVLSTPYSHSSILAPDLQQALGASATMGRCASHVIGLQTTVFPSITRAAQTNMESTVFKIAIATLMVVSSLLRSIFLKLARVKSQYVLRIGWLQDVGKLPLLPDLMDSWTVGGRQRKFQGKLSIPVSQIPTFSCCKSCAVHVLQIRQLHPFYCFLVLFNAILRTCPHQHRPSDTSNEFPRSPVGGLLWTDVRASTTIPDDHGRHRELSARPLRSNAWPWVVSALRSPARPKFGSGQVVRTPLSYQDRSSKDGKARGYHSAPELCNRGP